MQKHHIILTDSDRTTLEALLAKGTLSAKTFKRATALLELDRGKTLQAVAYTLCVNYNTIAAWRQRYTTHGLDGLEDAPRCGRPSLITGLQRAKITALACSDAPEGHHRWTLRLLAEKAVQMEVCEAVSHTFVGTVLKKNDLKPHLSETWCIGKLDATFVAKMEHVLATYALPYDPSYPVVCFDERPCFLIGDTLVPVPMQEGQVRKQHYQYEKFGSCALLCAIEPLTGKRIGQVHPQRTKREYTTFCQALAQAYPQALKIRLVQDNLNTHTASSFYAHLSAEEAFALAERFEFIYTPKSASWLNMIECEFSVVSRLCLNRRIPTIDKLRSEVLALLHERTDKQIKINWQFSIADARSKLNSHYTKVHPANEKYKQT